MNPQVAAGGTGVLPKPSQINLPQEGMVFTDSNNGNYFPTAYTVKDGKIVQLTQQTHQARTDLRLADGTIVKAGAMVPIGQTGDVTPIYGASNSSVRPEVYGQADTNFSGAYFTPSWSTPGYTNDQIKALPAFNIADISAYAQRNGGSLPNTPSATINATQGNQPNPTDIAAAQAAQTQQLGTSRTNQLPAGWDAQTYANFKAANPNLEPTAEDTARMQSAGPNSNANYYNLPGSTGSTLSGTTQSTPGGSPSTSGAAGAPDLSKLPPEFQGLYQQLDQYLQKLQQNGQVLNPAIQLTPDKIAQFLSQAHAEIDPYYSGQLKLATDSLSSQLGYAQNQLQTNEGRAQTAYQDQLRGIGEQSADQGFAQSGIRNRVENKLATDTNNSLTDARNAFSNSAGNAARGFAQQYGTANLPSMTMNGAPSVTAGEQNFTQNTRQLPLYQLSSSVYDGLKGSSEYQQSADVQNRASQLEGAFNSNNAIAQARQLNL